MSSSNASVIVKSGLGEVTLYASTLREGKKLAGSLFSRIPEVHSVLVRSVATKKVYLYKVRGEDGKEDLTKTVYISTAPKTK